MFTLCFYTHRIAYDFRDPMPHPSARLSKWIRKSSSFAYYASNQPNPIQNRPPVNI